MKFSISLILACFFAVTSVTAQHQNLRQYGIEIGVMTPGDKNAITDVDGVAVGHQTLVKADSIRTGVTAILPHRGNIFQQKVPGAVYVGNGFGKLAGSTQIEELGTIETPIILTNTLSVPTAADAIMKYSMNQDGNESVRSVNPVVGETNDGYLNDIRGQHVTTEDVFEAIEAASTGPVQQGNVGAGTGTIAFGFKGGIGTSSRKLPDKLEGYTVGVLVQTNFGGVLTIAGVPIGKELNKYYLSDELNDSPDGSCMIIVATDAPLSSRNLKRLAKRAIMGLARTGGIASNGSGDYVISFSTAESVRVPYQSQKQVQQTEVLRNSAMSPLFMAVNEATEEAIINSMFYAETMTGHDDHTIQALPIPKVLDMLEKYRREPAKAE